MIIRVLIADDQPEVRSALRLVLDAQPDMEVTGEAADGAQAIGMAHRDAPDVVLVDIRMPRLDGLAAIRELAGGPAALIALTTFDTDEYLFGALQAGAAGFLLKDNDPEVLLHAVRTAHRGHGLIDPVVTRRLIHRFAALSPPVAPGLQQLTPREQEVLLAMAGGSSNAEIAAQLWIEEGTVKTHVARVLAKLGLRTRVHAVIYAHRYGLVS